MDEQAKIIEELQAALDADKIDLQKFLELSTALAKSDRDHLRFFTDSGAISHLGRDSIKDHTTAIVELVKNAYDADASFVEIDINTSGASPFIRIADDGIGMSTDEVFSNWLRIGYSEKRKNPKSKKSRRKTGEKGIGRLSADRLGKDLTLVTIAAGSDAFGLRVEWESFNQPGKDLVLIPLKRIKQPEISIPQKGKNSGLTGTELKITEIRDSWDKNDIQDLFDELSILVPSYKHSDDFVIWLSSDVEGAVTGKIEPPSKFVPEVSFRLWYEGNEEGKVKYQIKDRFGISTEEMKDATWDELRGDVVDIRQKEIGDIYYCGPIEYELNFFLRNAKMAKALNVKLGDLKDYMNKNSGIKIYRDDISVKPYGYSGREGNDWLHLDKRQASDPAGIGRATWKANNDQIIGTVKIGRDSNPFLEDSSAREGLVHNDQYYTLRALVLAGLRILEMHRIAINKNLNPDHDKDKKSARKKLADYKEELELLRKELEELKSKLREYPEEEVVSSSEQLNIVIGGTASTEKSIDEILNNNRTLSGLATIGISSAVFGHETISAISQISGSAQLVAGEMGFEDFDKEVLRAEVDKILKYSTIVEAWGDFALARIKRDKRRKTKINVRQILNSLAKQLKPNFEIVGIDFDYSEIQPIEFRTFGMDIETMVLNLLTNAYSACLRSNRARSISLKVFAEIVDGKEGVRIEVGDSGPGIPEDKLDAIWEPLFTTKTDSKGRETGTGLGLSIIDSIIEELNGYRSIETDGELGGAKFIIWLPTNKK